MDLLTAQLEKNLHISRQDNVIAPIHRLADDIFVLIFEEAVNTTETDILEEPRAVVSEAPWSLASVCTRWRVVCLDSPQLWTVITQSRNTLGNHCLGALEMYRITVQLRRSRNRSLHGRLSGTVDNPSEHVLSAMREVVAAFPRFRTLELRGRIPMEILPSIPLTCDRLERLVIDGLGWLQNTGDSFLKTPVLEFLTLASMPLMPRVSSRPWHNIVSFASVTTLEYLPDISNNYSVLHWSDILRTLSLTPLLSSLTLALHKALSRPWPDGWSPNDTIVLPSLRYLRIIHEYTLTDMYEFFGHLRAPNLRTLDAGWAFVIDETPSFNSIIQESLGGGNYITSLTVTMSLLSSMGFRFYVATPADMRTLFSLLDSLQYLHLHGTKGRSASPGDILLKWLQELTWPTPPSEDHLPFEAETTSARLCPNLKELRCSTGWKVDEVPWEGLRTLVRSRLQDLHSGGQDITNDARAHLVTAPGAIDAICTPGRYRSRLEVITVEVLGMGESSGLADAVDHEHEKFNQDAMDKETERESLMWLVEADRSGLVKVRF